MINKFGISGFKCFKNQSFDIDKITILTGANGTGKSSFIQALLIVRLAIERNLTKSKDQDYLLFDKKKGQYFGNFWKGELVPLNNGYQLKLGTIFDIIRNDETNSKIVIELDNESYLFSLPEELGNETSMTVDAEYEHIANQYLPFWRKNEFYYLNTERLGPRHSSEINFTEYLHCGYEGQYTAQVLANIGPSSSFESAMLERGMNLTFETNKWLKDICPGVTIDAKKIGRMLAQITVSQSAAKSDMLSTNIGFGISYVLPIIVTGLIAKKSTVFVVENPEAHLHPKGQSNIGYFLGKVADADVKVIVETHSEHLINGMRRALMESKKITPYEANIYFFNGLKDSKLDVETIKIDEYGNFSNFPLDFFDQVNQDIGSLFHLRRKDG